MFDEAFAPARTTGVAGGARGGGAGATVERPGADCVGLQLLPRFATTNHCHAPACSDWLSRWSSDVDPSSDGAALLRAAKTWYRVVPGTALQAKLTGALTVVRSPGAVRIDAAVAQSGGAFRVNVPCADSTLGQPLKRVTTYHSMAPGATLRASDVAAVVPRREAGPWSRESQSS